jgi:hypothetical protein
VNAFRPVAGLVLGAAIWAVAAPAAHGQGITNPAKHPAPVTVTIDGQTYGDGRDTLPGYDDELCTPIPNVQYDFAENQVLYYSGEGELLKTARWTEWARISSYQTWLDQQNAATPTPTATATATPAATTTAPATPTPASSGTTSPAPTGPAATSPTTTAPTTKSPGATKRPSTKTTRSSTTRSARKTPTTKQRQAPSSPSAPSTSTSTTSKDTTSSPATKSGTVSPSPNDAPTSDSAEAAPVVDGAPADAATTAGPADSTVGGATPAPTGGGASPAPVPQTTTNYKLASERGVAGTPGDTRLAGAGILAGLVAVAFFCLLFGELRHHAFGRR